VVGIFDTPGWFDSDGRDQEMVDEFLTVLKAQPQGVHLIVFCLSVYDPRYTSSLKEAFGMMVKLLGGSANLKPTTVVVLLTKANTSTRIAWDQNLETRMAQWKQELGKAIGVSVRVLTHGSDPGDDNAFCDLVLGIDMVAFFPCILSARRRVLCICQANHQHIM
jgi:hypothetical protein